MGRTRISASPPATEPFAPETLLFDFDGTLADTFAAGLEILNLLSQEFGFRKVGANEAQRIREMSVTQVLDFLGVRKIQLPRIARRGSEELRRRIHEIQPFPGMVETMETLHRRGYRLAIVTSNTEDNVLAFLKNHGLEIFENIRCSSKLLGKARVIRSVLRQMGSARSRVLFIGDEIRDVDACRRAGVRIAAVGWGYSGLSALTALNPDVLLDAPDQLAALLPAPGRAWTAPALSRP